MTRNKNRACTILSAFLGTFLILAVIIAYSQFVTLKKALITKISNKATALIGQEVEIGNISLSTAAGITIRDIVIRNPEGFIHGDLLTIDSVHLGVRYGELFKRRFSFRGIEVESPKLTLITGRNGKLNVADMFMMRLLKKGTAAYQVDRLVISNAGFSINADPLFTIRDIDFTMNGLSSAPGTKTSVNVSLAYLGDNRLAAEGWVFLKDQEKKFSIDLSSEMTDLSLLVQRLATYGMAIGKGRALMAMHAEGDMDKGVRMSTDISLKNAGIPLFKKGAKDISFSAEAFLDPAADALAIDSAVLRIGEVSSIQVKGSLRSLRQSPSYEAEVKIDRLDLSAFTVMKGLKAEGIVNSDLMRLKGSLSGVLPEMSGTSVISNGSLEMEKVLITSINGKLVLATGKDFSLRAEAAAELKRIGNLSFRQPSAVTFLLEGKGTLQDIVLSSKLRVSDLDTSVNGKSAVLKNTGISFDGYVRQRAVSGKIVLAATGMRYENFGLRDLSLKFDLDHNNHKTTAKGLSVESEIMRANADTITMNMPDATGTYRIEAKNISALYPDQKAGLSGLDCVMTLMTGGKALSGEIMFSLKKASFRDAPVEIISGKLTFDGNVFAVDIPGAHVLGGSVNILAKGSTQKGPFPLHIDMSADHLDLGQASAVLRSLSTTPYRAAGILGRFSFVGTAASAESITGTALLRAKNISVMNNENRNIIKDALINADAIFRGKDLDVKADATIGNLSSSLSGTVSRFGSSDRYLRLNISIPELKVNDIRTAFWDMFPDALLYTGLDGSIGLKLTTTYGSGTITAEGAVLLKDIMIEGENNEYSAGPVSGTLPVHYNSAARREKPDALPSVGQADFEGMKKRYTEPALFGGSEINIGAIRYGFRLLHDISLRLEQQGRTLNISSFSANMFGGRLSGAAVIDLSPGLTYQAGLIVDAVSLSQLCEDIVPIKGYISGKANGIAAIRGSGAGLTKIIGKADFWTYSDQEETTRISREFLEKIGGPQVRAYLGERRFNKGIMNIYLQNGFLIFRDLEISNRNFLGMTDLSVKVAPLNNRIAIDHLMWTITEAAQRAKKK